ncbi:MAG: aminopeptidase, partial [Ignavibacteriales bacterium]
MASAEKERNAWLKATEQERKEFDRLGSAYIDFLNAAKTERETVKWIEEQATAAKFVGLQDVKNLKPGSKVLITEKHKIAILAVIGQKPMSEGFNIVASHGDTPRIDLKPAPLYEDGGLALFKTHYYGGIKKYQWTALPLAMHGVVIKTSGQKIEIEIGESDRDPVFTITDLLPHLAKDQMEKKMSEGVTGEGL